MCPVHIQKIIMYDVFTMSFFTESLQFPWKEISVFPVQWHALGLGLFASIIAPFGGFFASGFKRAFKIKVHLVYCLFCLNLIIRMRSIVTYPEPSSTIIAGFW